MLSGGRGKKTAWETWKSDDGGHCAALCSLSATPNPITADECLGLLEVVVLLYDRTRSM